MSIPSFLFRTMRVYGKVLPKRTSGRGKVAAEGRTVTRVRDGVLFVAIISTKSSCVVDVVGSSIGFALPLKTSSKSVPIRDMFCRNSEGPHLGK